MRFEAPSADLSASVPDVPPEHQHAAEEIRAHLVAVRGGAPFLSSADARLLVGWLDDGVGVSDVLRAIERAAEARRKRRARLPLSLTRVKAHLGKGRPAAPSAATGFQPAIDALRARGEHTLADTLAAIDAPDPEERLRRALAAVRPFLHARWDALPRPEREARIRAACEELAALELDENEVPALAEEIVRDEIRREWPMLDAEALFQQAHGGRA